MIRVAKKFKDRYELEFRANRGADPLWARTLNNVKTIPGRMWHATKKTWIVPRNDAVETLILKFGFLIEDGVEPGEEKVAAAKDFSKFWGKVEIPDEPGLDVLRPYQVDMLQFLIWRNGNAIIGDGMGFGKTVEALSYPIAFPDKRPVLMIVPSNVKMQWCREFKRFTGETARLLEGETPHKLTKKYSIVLNPAILPHWLPELLKIDWQIAIVDEFHLMLSSPTSNRSKAWMELAKRIPHKLLLSGTPIRKNVPQFWVALWSVVPKKVPGYYQYCMRFGAPKNDGYGIKYTGLSNGVEFQNILSSCMLRRTDSDKVLGLEACMPVPVYLELVDTAAYEKALAAVEEFTFGSEMEEKKALLGLQRSSFAAKEKAVYEWIDAWLESNDGKLIIFGYHRSVVEAVHEKYKKISTIVYGGITAKQKDKRTSKFINNKKCRLMIGNLTALGTGTDGMQAVCNNAVFVELGLKTDVDQAIARIHRSGQDKVCWIYYLLGIGTVDEQNLANIDQDTTVFNKAVDGRLTEDDELLSNMGEGVY